MSHYLIWLFSQHIISQENATKRLENTKQQQEKRTYQEILSIVQMTGIVIALYMKNISVYDIQNFFTSDFNEVLPKLT